MSRRTIRLAVRENVRFALVAMVSQKLRSFLTLLGVMVGVATLLFLISLYYGGHWLFRRRLPQGRWFLRIASACGVLSVICLEAGWIVAEVGRQPWIVYNYMKVEDAATANTYVWVTFIAVVVLYAGLGYAAIRVLRTMSRRSREGDGFDDHDTPYGPSGPLVGRGPS